MNLAMRALRRGTLALVGRDRMSRLMASTARLLEIDLIQLAYRDSGILNYETQVVSGEQFVISRVLPRLVRKETPVLFDVGANIGEVSVDLRLAFPNAAIWAFEPNPITFAQLEKTVGAYAVSCQNMGLGEAAGEGTLHCYSSNQQSGHASIYRDVFSLYQHYGIKESADLTTFRFAIATLDDFCAQHGIAAIDFLKIDVEGHELAVLKGASGMIAAGSIPVIQFEFNECNVMSRAFLQDFYHQLPQHRFYRLKQSGLLPLGPYQGRHEIFQFQNILAIHKDLTENVSGLTTR